MALNIKKTLPITEVEFSGILFKIAPSSNTDYRRKLQAGINHLRKKDATLKADLSNLDPEQNDKLMAESAAGTLLQGWSGLQDDGVDVPFSEAKAKEILLDKDNGLLAFVFSVASDRSEFAPVDQADLVKKPVIDSTGS